MGFLSVKNLKVHYPIRGGFFNTIVDYVYAVDGVDLEIEEGKSYGLIGESGSGKSTIGKAIVGLEKLTDGTILYGEEDVTNKRARKRIQYNKDVQMIFQDSLSSLDPKKRVYDIIGEPLRNFDRLSPKEERVRTLELLDIVGMPSDAIYKYPHEFSGGQRQRLGVARAVASNPKLIIADEPTSALDLSVQAQVLNYMKDIQDQFNLTYLFISHDLGVVRHMCDYINIMHRGRFVETGTREDIYNHPQHIYTKRLIAAIPEVDPNIREEIHNKRIAVENEFLKEEDRYYDKEGRVYDLEPLSDTHFVAGNKELIREKQGGEL
ncbi:MAG: ATP-binding cassette domain-containing protein [Tissierellia bacterium]|nr:ATP-binding cassette domain-containing protein [Tissierellia bacterium]